MTEAEKPKKKIALLIPKISQGGAERVLSLLANEFVDKETIEVHLVLLVGGDLFYHIDERVKVHQPDFSYKNYNRFIFTIRLLVNLRNKLKEINPDYLLSFGGKYNSFVILSSYGLKIKKFLSDRSRPGISYGFVLDRLNKILYRSSYGLIAQTKAAKKYLWESTKHRNIRVIPNPVINIYNPEVTKENIILNVGRFIRSKQQHLLIDIFNNIDNKEWKLWLVGHGEYFNACKQQVANLGLQEKVVFWGNQTDIYPFYQKSKIFAFTSISEGFPNSLAEAMSAGCACISFDCNAGPADLIDNGTSGILIENNNKEEFLKQLKALTENEQLIRKFSGNATIISTKLAAKKIADEYYNFIIGTD